jgi:RNA-directed DNA polymerase
MAPPSIVAAALAEALEAGSASPRSVASRWASVLGFETAPAWLGRMARRVAARVAQDPPRRRDDLVRLLERDRGLSNAAVGGALGVRRWILAPASMLPAPGPLATWDVPRLATSGDVAAWLDLSVPELEWFAGTEGRSGRTPPGKLAHYRCRWRKKPSGGLRLLEAPKLRLMAIQRRVLHEILDRVPAHAAAHGFTKRRSILTHAAPHAGAAIVIVMDLASFFAQVRASRVFALFRTLGYPEPVARLFTGLTTCATPREVWAEAPPPRTARDVRERFSARRFYRAPHLPQGAPTSPALANLAAYRLDVRLDAAATSCGARYTRYADDLTFSGGAELRRRARAFTAMALRIAAEEGFAVNPQKTRFLTQSVPQRVTGLVVNARPNVPRSDRKLLEAILFNARRDGPASQNRTGHPDFRAHLMGRVAWIESVDVRRGAELRRLFDAIDWNR